MTPLTVEERFQICMQVILEHEGGLSNDKRDPGGVTNWGISLRFLRASGLEIDGNDHADAEEIIALTKPNAIEVYREAWWVPYHYADFIHIEVVSKVFDLSVNMGSMSAHKVLQEACNTLIKPPLTVDGLLGANTFHTANALDPFSLRQALRESAKERYLAILADKPAMEWARNAWLSRAAW
jgi:lysozyme family protein